MQQSKLASWWLVVGSWWLVVGGVQCSVRTWVTKMVQEICDKGTGVPSRDCPIGC